MNRSWRWITCALMLAFAVIAPAVAADNGHGETPELIPMDPGTIIPNVIVTLVIFLIVIGVLRKYAWSPILNVLNEREKSIRESLETARDERQQAEQLLEQYKAQLQQAREEATAIVTEGRRDAEVVRERLQAEAREQADQIVERARREIRLATDSAVKELYDKTAELAVHVAGGIIRKELSPDDHRQFVADSLKKMEESGRVGLN